VPLYKRVSLSIDNALNLLDKTAETVILWPGYANWSTGRVSLERLMLKLSW